LIFIPQFGFRAAAVTTIFSELVLWIPFAILMQRGLGAPLGWIGLLWRPIVATGAMIGTAIVLLPVHLLLALMVASVVYVLVLLALNPLDAEERAILLPLLPQRIRGLPFVRIARQP
ncbi:MAG: polysaccharide biosynthesis C-terminal domain-containing protein, partial [Anaerolineae bacterium]|nr:polysaccharide biosynthesis C-terminal domain-containing protein [Anaerolineae bacterium]